MDFSTLSEIAGLPAFRIKSESLFNIRDFFLNLTWKTHYNKHTRQMKIPSLHQSTPKISHYK